MTAPGTSSAATGGPTAETMSWSAGANAAGSRSATDCVKMIKRVSIGTVFWVQLRAPHDAPMTCAAL